MLYFTSNMKYPLWFRELRLTFIYSWKRVQGEHMSAIMCTKEIGNLL